MKRILVVTALAAMLTAVGGVAAAHQDACAGPCERYYSDAYDDSQAHPLRLAAYFVHPVGYLLEWVVVRPLHTIFAQPSLEPVFGHHPHERRLPDMHRRY